MFAPNKNIKIHDFTNICRTCLHTTDLKPIHDYVLIEILHKIADITYIQNDGFPQQICNNCVRRIYEIKAFAVQCKQIDFVLKKCVVDSNNEHFNDHIPVESIHVKEEPTDADENAVKSVNMDLVTSLKDHKHFLAMETEEESSSNEDEHQQYITKVNYHRNLMKNSANITSHCQGQATSSNMASDTSDEDRADSSLSVSSKEDKSILKQMLKQQNDQDEDEAKEAPDLTYECGLCLKQFYQLKQFMRHQSEHSDRSAPKCDLCHVEFNDYATVSEHKKTVHAATDKFQCLICFKTFKDGTYLTRHGRVHGNRPYKCDQCDKTYIESGHLVVHKRTHTGERPFACESCPKAFVSLSNLVKHRVVHTGLRKIFTCDICGKEMNDPSNLRKHRRVHTKEKPFKCKYCEAAFSGASDLRAHERLHTGERPYACDVCGRKFSRSTYLTKHKKTCGDAVKCAKNEGDAGASDLSETVIEPHVKMETVE